MTSGHLLDTQAFLLWRLDDPSFGRKAARLLDTATSGIHLSIASVWEICIKRSIGKLDLDVPTQELVETAVAAGVRLLPLRPEHLYRVESLPWHHRDPFDRLLLAQALVEDLTVVGRDPEWPRYGVKLVW